MGKELGTSELTSEEESLLNLIIDKGVREIKPFIGPRGVSYENLADIEEKYDGEGLHRLLRSLHNKGFLTARETDRAIFCPQCRSAIVFSKYGCPDCQSQKVKHIELIEHPFCGYTGVKDKFISDSSLVCPNCKTHLGSIDGKPQRDDPKKNYKIVGSSFECEECGSRFNKPNVLYHCQECEASFDYKTAKYEKLYNYEVPEEVIKTIRARGKLVVILIEDNYDDAEIITRYLERSKEPFKIEHVVSGREGLEKIEQEYFDVILLDYKLPDMNGLEVLDELQKKNIGTPIIMLTGADDRKIAVDSMKLGASDFIVKSVETYKQLPSIIKNIIR